MSIQFGRVPYAVLNSGVIATIKPGALRVYLALCMSANQDWQTTVGMRRMAELTGMMIGSVSRSIAELKAAGLIHIETRGNGSVNHYTITTSPEQTVHSSVNAENTTVRACANASVSPTVHRGANTGGETVHPGATHPVHSGANGSDTNRSLGRERTVHWGANETERQTDSNNQNLSVCLSETDDHRRKAFEAMTRAVGRSLSFSDDDHLDRFARTLKPPIRIHGDARDPWELIHRAMVEAAANGECQTAKGAVGYCRKVVERCIQHECWPGEFPDKPAKKRYNAVENERKRGQYEQTIEIPIITD